MEKLMSQVVIGHKSRFVLKLQKALHYPNGRLVLRDDLIQNIV